MGLELRRDKNQSLNAEKSVLTPPLLTIKKPDDSQIKIGFNLNYGIHQAEMAARKPRKYRIEREFGQNFKLGYLNTRTGTLTPGPGPGS